MSAARKLLDFDAERLANPARAKEQLRGSVALHNILERHRVAYLADEVGMGKTYVALGVAALLRHYRPDARILVIAPRKNIQLKWQKELLSVARNNYRIPDLRFRTPHGEPVRPLTHCENLIGLSREARADPNRDFFARLSSFSLGTPDKAKNKRARRDEIRREIPWLPSDFLATDDVTELKDRYAEALNSILPEFDLVIVDEAHNLKHGYSARASSRNRVLAGVIGRPGVNQNSLEGAGLKARRVLLLSATPIDDDYRQLYNQLDLFGLGRQFRVLADPEAEVEAKRAAVAEFLVRRVTSLEVGGETLTKNLYRREWRQGGVEDHDEPLPDGGVREQLTVALVQKKVAELIGGDEEFGAQFQMGMLASFESFLETAARKASAADDASLQQDETPEGDGSNFDGREQTRLMEDQLERDGVDVGELNHLARSHRREFEGRDMAHPKMDAIVNRLAPAFARGEKSLVFVRRVASVSEMKRKLDDEYDSYVVQRLRRDLPARHRRVFDGVVSDYRQRRRRADVRREDRAQQDESAEDRGGLDTFFAYFFRASPRGGLFSGQLMREGLNSPSGQLATFFERNLVMELLGSDRRSVISDLAKATGLTRAELRREIGERSRRYLSGMQPPQRREQFTSAQAAALELLRESDERAKVLHQQLFFREEGPSPSRNFAKLEQVETETFFSKLCSRPALRGSIWPESNAPRAEGAVREEILRAQLLAACARLGHSSLDLWLTLAAGRRSIAGRVAPSDQRAAREKGIGRFLDRLEAQASTPLEERDWGAWDELSEIAENFELILKVNLRQDDLGGPADGLPALMSGMLAAQQPVAGMSERINPRSVRQFRMPGYPFVMVTTELLQEGEDLHTFCSSMHHYGLAWTPSALEQRVGRIDRVHSQSERRLSALSGAPTGEEKLQVHYPHLRDSVERLQVRRALRRMDDFIRLMHRDIASPARVTGALDVGAELSELDIEMPSPHAEPLKSAFREREADLRGELTELAVGEGDANDLERRFAALRNAQEFAHVDWEDAAQNDYVLGTATLDSGRLQPFGLQLEWWKSHALVRCVSPVGKVATGFLPELVKLNQSLKIGLGFAEPRLGSYDITVEEDVLLLKERHDAVRVATLVRRVIETADELELKYLPEKDRVLHDFRPDLDQERRHGR
jgi:superfamily II DNA or RNA helicase